MSIHTKNRKGSLPRDKEESEVTISKNTNQRRTCDGIDIPGDAHEVEETGHRASALSWT